MATGRNYQREVISSAECWFCVLYRLSGVELRLGSAEISAAQEAESAAILGVFWSAEFFDPTGCGNLDSVSHRLTPSFVCFSGDARPIPDRTVSPVHRGTGRQYWRTMRRSVSPRRIRHFEAGGGRSIIEDPLVGNRVHFRLRLSVASLAAPRRYSNPIFTVCAPTPAGSARV